MGVSFGMGITSSAPAHFPACPALSPPRQWCNVCIGGYILVTPNTVGFRVVAVKLTMSFFSYYHQVGYFYAKTCPTQMMKIKAIRNGANFPPPSIPMGGRSMSLSVTNEVANLC